MALVDQYAGVIFDYGGVLAFHQSRPDVERLARIAGFEADILDQLYWAQRGLYDKGMISGEEYWGAMAHKRGREFSADTIRQLIEADNESWTKFDTAMYGFVAQLRAAGKRVAVLSNMPRDLGEDIKNRTEGFAPFHHLTLSYEVRSIKPEAAIYEHCLEGLGISARETLFLDDRAENIAGAKELGIGAIQFTSRDEVLPWLMS